MTAPDPPLLFRRAEVAPGRVADVRVAAGVISDVAAGPLRPSPGDRVVDAAGNALLPGLHDHHVHLLSLAAAASSVRAGPPWVDDPAGLRAALRSAARGASAGAGGGPGGGPGAGPRSDPAAWIRAVGYHPAVAGDLDRFALDDLLPDRPVRLQYRTGELWVLNSLALGLAGVDRCPRPGVERDAAGAPTGRLWRMDAWLRDAVPAMPVDLARVGRMAAAAGVIGFTDATPARSAAEEATLAAAVASGALPQRLTLMRAERTDPGARQPPAGRGTSAGRAASATGWGATGSASPTDGSASPTDGGPHRDGPAPGRLTWGPVKFLLDDSTLPDPSALAARVRAAHRGGAPVAVHCVTRVQLVVTLAALAEAGTIAGDRIEHGAVVPPDLREPLRALGLTVVTQPNFVAERGDRYLADVTDEDPAALYPAASLLAAGIKVAGGTDAPFGEPDPWAAVAAAVHRRTASGVVLGPSERLSPERALDLFLGDATAPHRPRAIRPGGPADLCLLRLPRAAAARQPAADLVALTVVGGRVVVGS